MVAELLPILGTGRALYWVQILISLLVIAIFAGAAALWDDDDLPWRKPRSQPKKWLSAQITLGQRIAPASPPTRSIARPHRGDEGLAEEI